MSIPVIDIFAGPGGLSEGFSSVTDANGNRVFKISLSVEKDIWAHRTLELRAFYRQFEQQNVPGDYFDYLRGSISREILFERYPHQATAARRETMLAELGAPEQQPQIDQLLAESIPQNRPWILIGGPPCQVYSVIGRARMKGGGISFMEDERHLLYKQYLRVIAQHSPAVFVMENVKGILSSQVAVREGMRAMFDQVQQDLQDPVASTGIKRSRRSKLKYRIYSLVVKSSTKKKLVPGDFVVECEKYGIPQCRHRVILLGVRQDIKNKPDVLDRGESAPRVKDVIGDLPKLRSTLSKESDSHELWKNAISEILDAPVFSTLSPAVREIITESSTTCSKYPTNGGEWIEGTFTPAKLDSWFCDSRLGGVCNHTARSHMRSDLHRYIFASSYAVVSKVSPQIQHFPEALLPAHQNVTSGAFDDRFRVQLSDKPSTTITSHISKDGHYHIHYDPSQCRSLTVREAARLQTFPDNYFFEGPRTQQYKQVGNAVPPLLASKVGKIVYDLLSSADLTDAK